MDEGAFVLDYITPPGTSLEETDRILNHIEKFLRKPKKSKAIPAEPALALRSLLPSRA
jgi:hypothetical protein